eukprot:TRINITY_DN317_c0_g1_i5.p1 TRINITY_DN317_c0_g1~~TRINITY_DN317_c0_g1_i5.p1  ORF type:complete len:197 (-),score=53.21 TRINITY_DN317_c0_g1_i5:254-844(-)
MKEGKGKRGPAETAKGKKATDRYYVHHNFMFLGICGNHHSLVVHTDGSGEAIYSEIIRKKSLGVTGRRTKPQLGKAKKDPNQPKRPPTAFFVFLEEFRKTFKAENPNVKAVTAVGKACGDKWKKMSAEEKAPYAAKAAQMRVQYDKSMTAYKKKKKNAEEEESQKSKSEMNDDEGSEEVWGFFLMFDKSCLESIDK